MKTSSLQKEEIADQPLNADTDTVPADADTTNATNTSLPTTVLVEHLNQSPSNAPALVNLLSDPNRDLIYALEAIIDTTDPLDLRSALKALTSGRSGAGKEYVNETTSEGVRSFLKWLWLVEQWEALEWRDSDDMQDMDGNYQLESFQEPAENLRKINGKSNLIFRGYAKSSYLLPANSCSGAREEAADMDWLR